MKDHFNDIEFNQFLQNETEKHKMFPSDKIWRNIQQEMHGKKKWPALTVIAFLIITALTVSTIVYDHPSKPSFQTVSIAALSENRNSIPKSITTQRSNSSKDNTRSNIREDKETSKHQAMLINSIVNKDLVDLNIPATTQTPEVNVLPVVITEKELTVAQNINKKEGVKKEITINDDANISAINISSNQNQVAIVQKSSTNNTNNLVKENTYTKSSNFALLNNLQNSNPLLNQETESDIFVNEFGYASKIPVIAKRKKTRFELQFYATPSVSYRKLVDDKTRNKFDPSGAANGPFSPRYSVDVNDVVRHKPAMGTEIGLGILYKINHRLKLKTGLQYNVRKYYIDTYKSGLNIASIAIIRNNRLDTINQFSTLSANNGYAESQINSKLLQISVPVGIEYNLLQAKKFGINVAATIQPTLTLNKNVYLISTDYKYYTDGTSFFRKWNINSSFELNLTYQVGNFNWFLGTQARFQHLPTYNEKYPIKEYRMDYGLKFGFSKQLFK